ncbi:adenylate kinase family protein [Kitasatospora sp. NPDC089509]|uniref:adenylate kinase family protein n=1 Tax=Kitasatospora sp. NPDC089509 TaxID=3364079 RepID=UPI003813E650
MRVVLLQPPAWRLGSPADVLAETLATPRIGLGDLFRAHLSQGTELGNRCREVIRSDGPVTDEIIMAVVHERLRRTVPAAFLLDGHPHNTTRARALDEMLRELGIPLGGVLHLHLSEHETERRILRWAARRLCREDSTHGLGPGHGYGDAYQPGEVFGDGPCEVCGGELYQREDDREERVRGRISTYRAMIEPVIRYYADQDLLTTIDAAGTHEEIAGRALAALRRRGY